jgi:DNA-binding phage protein
LIEKKLDKDNFVWYINTMLKISKMLREIIEEKEKTSIRRVAKAIGVDHGSLYRALREGGNPEGKTIEKILDYLGYQIQFTKSKRREAKKGKQELSRRDHKTK